LSNEDQPESGADPLNSGLAGSNKQPSAPAAPLPVGGDVTQAKLISAVPPTYPALAKNQHVSGNVLIDALIDANGRVTTMKVVSGPTLLHQAAMDALKQWKYRPATLDGKPVPMHLTVTIQFRLQ
jgi:protein TonB